MFLHRDAIITCIVNTLTCLLAGVLVFSILGYMAFITGSTIHDVVNSGPGLVFLTYPDLVLSLPGSVVWATIFFVMLLVLGIDSEFCNVEALVTGIVDNWPDQLLKHRRKFTIALCLGLFCLGLPLCTHVSISEKFLYPTDLIFSGRNLHVPTVRLLFLLGIGTSLGHLLPDYCNRMVLWGSEVDISLIRDILT